MASVVDLGDKLLESFRAPAPHPVVAETVAPALESLGSAGELPAPTELPVPAAALSDAAGGAGAGVGVGVPVCNDPASSVDYTA